MKVIEYTIMVITAGGRLISPITPTTLAGNIQGSDFLKYFQSTVSKTLARAIPEKRVNECQ